MPYNDQNQWEINIQDLRQDPHYFDFLEPSELTDEVWNDPGVKEAFFKQAQMYLGSQTIYSLKRKGCPYFYELLHTFIQNSTLSALMALGETKFMPNNWWKKMNFDPTFWNSDEETKRVCMFFILSYVQDDRPNVAKKMINSLKQLGCNWPEFAIIIRGIGVT